MIKFMTFIGAVTCFGLSMSAGAAEESLKVRAKEAANDTKREMKKTVRKVKDETCTLTKGKMECAADKVKHTVQNGADSIEDAVE